MVRPTDDDVDPDDPVARIALLRSPCGPTEKLRAPSVTGLIQPHRPITQRAHFR